MIDNKIIIIGADHHNTLSVIRCLGKEKCDIRVVIHTSKTESGLCRVSCSRYSKGKVDILPESEEELIDYLNCYESNDKIILFPCSDFAMYCIDKHSESLQAKYLIPGFKDNPGRVVYLMDKWNQKIFAEKNNIPMAKTWAIQLNELSIPEDMIYPCIVKPAVSANGKKSDITICNSQEELKSALNVFVKSGYDDVIVQQFLNKIFEVCAYGYVSDSVKYNNDSLLINYGGTIAKRREWPVGGGGSLTLAQFIKEKEVEVLKDRILSILARDGYCGQYDIEFFVCTDGVYLNEINFRHSGNGYALIKNGVPAPYIGCLDLLSKPIPSKFKKNVKIGKYHMDELNDFQQYKAGHISLIKWISDILRTSAFSVFDISDMPGAYAFYKPYVSNVKKKLLSVIGKKGN